MRTFVALSVGDGPALRELVACRDELASSRADVKWVPAGHFHITVRFLGEVAESEMDGVRMAVRQAADAATGPVEANLSAAGCFQREGRPSAIWMQCHDKGEMADLERALSAALQRIGIPPERKPFRAHVTLGRAKSARGVADLMRAIDRWNAHGRSVPYRFDALTLFESNLTPTGPIYMPLLVAPLGARPPMEPTQEKEQSG